MVDGREVELDCICETTGQMNACEGGISEGQLIEAMQRVKNAQTDIPDLEEITELSKNN